MKRIVIMFLRNFYKLPYYLIRLLYVSTSKSYAKKYNEEEAFQFIKCITKSANRGGFVTVEAHGLENLPNKNGYVMFPNHQGLYDVLAMIETSPIFFSVVVKKELMKIGFLRTVFKIMGAYAIDREDVRQSMKVIQSVSEDVKNGKSFLIFPEGTRSRNGNEIGEFKGGSFKSATKAKCPIVPVAIIDSYKAFDTKSIEKVTVQVHYLETLYYDDYKMLKTHEIAEIVSEKIKKTIDNYTKC